LIAVALVKNNCGKKTPQEKWDFFLKLSKLQSAVFSNFHVIASKTRLKQKAFEHGTPFGKPLNSLVALHSRTKSELHKKTSAAQQLIIHEY